MEQWQTLDDELASLLAAARSSRDPRASLQVTESLRDQALNVWISADAAIGSMEHVFWAWVASAVAFTAFYSITGGTLLLQLRREVTYLRRAMINSAKSAEGDANVGPVAKHKTALIKDRKVLGFVPKHSDAGHQDVADKSCLSLIFAPARPRAFSGQGPKDRKPSRRGQTHSRVAAALVGLDRAAMQSTRR